MAGIDKCDVVSGGNLIEKTVKGMQGLAPVEILGQRHGKAKALKGLCIGFGIGMGIG